MTNTLPVSDRATNDGAPLRPGVNTGRGERFLRGEDLEPVMRDPLALAMMAAWVNVPVDKLPSHMRAHSCAATMEAWKRVGEAAVREITQSTADRVAELETALSKCRDQFDFYVSSHMAKTPPDMDKAATNQKFVELCDAALKGSSDGK